MSTRVTKPKLGSTKPATQLFLFSNTLNKNIEGYFSGNVIFEIELSGYDYKHHDEAKKVVAFMQEYCLSRSIKPYKFMTVVPNYKEAGLTMASLSGDYDYPIVVNGTQGYRHLTVVHSAFEILKARLSSFYEYEHFTLSYAHEAIKSPLNFPERSATALTNQLSKTEKSILKSISNVFATFNKKFQPIYHKQD